MTASAERIWCCRICGYEHRGDAPPECCPCCGAAASEFEAAEAPPPAAPAGDAAAGGAARWVSCWPWALAGFTWFMLHGTG